MQSTKSRPPVRKGDLIIAVILAVAAWVYVVYNIDPTMTRLYKNVPIDFVNEDVLTANDLALKSTEFSTINITLKGKRSSLDAVTDSSLEVSADLADAGKGENVLAIRVTAPDGTEVEGKSSDNITVVVEGRVTKALPVKAIFINLPENGTEPIVTEKSASEVEVTGAESSVGRAACAQITLDANKIGDKERTFSVKAVPVDDEGNAVSFLSVEPDKISATAIASKLKDVLLKVVVNNPESELGVRKYSAPETVTIKGLPDVLDGIDSISTESIDLSGVVKSCSIPITYDLPYGVDIASDSAGQTLEVNFTEYGSRTIVVKADEIGITGLGDGFTAEVLSNVKVVVTGDAGQISGIDSGAFTVVADASGVTESGKQKVRLTMSSAFPNARLTSDTVEINVKAQEKDRSDEAEDIEKETESNE